MATQTEKTKVLVIDDERLIRLTLNAKLKQIGFTAVCVASISEAVVLLNDDVAAMLQNASGEGELKLRINGKYDTFDVAIPAESLPSISETGRLALSLDQ